MPRFFVPRTQIENNKISLLGDDAHHAARSLRMAQGDNVKVCCAEDGMEYDCTVVGFDSDREVFLSVNSCKHSESEPPVKIALFQALSKGDKLDTVIQKSVECGVSLIVPFESERCIAKMQSDTEDKKTERRRRIAAEAAKQSGRGILPEVRRTLRFEDMLTEIEKYPLVLFCYEGGMTEPLGKILAERLVQDVEGRYPDIALVVGSEGGFSSEEAKRAEAAGAVLTGLGKRILRTETAPIFAISCIICLAELM